MITVNIPLRRPIAAKFISEFDSCSKFEFDSIEFVIDGINKNSSNWYIHSIKMPTGVGVSVGLVQDAIHDLARIMRDNRIRYEIDNQ